MSTLFWLLLIAAFIPLGYWWLMALASVKSPPAIETETAEPSTRFLIAIPAHNEENVIGNTIARLQRMAYPQVLFEVHIVADHCTDRTAWIARREGVFAHERSETLRSGKGAALTWLFKKVLADDTFDAVVVFDADTQVDPDFLRVMNAQLLAGHDVVQGQHIISNPDDGWFPALTWAMFLIDNRFQNQGRSNLGWSAKHMGDSICFRADVLRAMDWGEGLTEDFQFRQRLLLNGVKIHYDPRAKGYGEAPLTWQQARAQRARWLRGTWDASQRYARWLLLGGLKKRDSALLDAAMQAYFPSYSSLTLLGIAALGLQLIVNLVYSPVFPPLLLLGWAAYILILFIYPLVGLYLEKAPLKAYITILSGPIFMIWRTWLAVSSRFGRKQVTWVRTLHGGRK